MAGAWEFVDREVTDAPVRAPGHGPAMTADAESHALALATVGALIFEWDVATDRVSRPAGLQYLYGYHISEIEPTFAWLRARIHPDDVARDRERFLAQIAAHAPVIRGHYRVRHKDGHWIDVKTSAAAQYDARGMLTRIVGCTVDTDETAILEESQARLASVVSHSNDAIFSIDNSGLIATWNDGARRLYGYDADEVIGRSLEAIIPEDERPASRRALDEIRGGETLVFQAARMHRDGMTIAVEISGAPIRSPSGRVLGISTIHRDVTAARRTALADARFAAVVGRFARRDHHARCGEPHRDLEQGRRGIVRLARRRGGRAADRLPRAGGSPERAG